MKKSELRKLVAEYKEIKIKLLKSNSNTLNEKLKQLDHRYYHETGNMLKKDLKEIT